METLLVWSRVAGHSLKLTLRALRRSWPWLLVAPAVSLALDLASSLVLRMAGGMVGGFIIGFLYAVALALLVYVGRSIIEQRKLRVDELAGGVQAFIGEVMNVLFVLWIASMVAGWVAPPLAIVLAVAVVVVPLIETVGLAPTGGFSSFTAAWEFFRRDWAPWLMGQLPLFVLYGVWKVASDQGLASLSEYGTGFSLRYATLGVGALGTALLFAAFIYRGVLYLTLDGVAPRARRTRFGSKAQRAA